MGSINDKAKGFANQAAGKVKEGVADATDNPKLKGEALAQQGKGKAQEMVGNAKEAIKKAGDL